MKATSALQAAQEYGGWNLEQSADIAADEIIAYFSEDNFRAMFPGEDATECGGYTLDACADAIIEWQEAAHTGGKAGV